MTINGLRGINPLDKLDNTQKATPKSSVSMGSDSISISSEAKEMAEVYYMNEVAKETPDVRADLVEAVKEKIKDPSYLSAAVIQSTADKILSSFGL